MMVVVAIRESIDRPVNQSALPGLDSERRELVEVLRAALGAVVGHEKEPLPLGPAIGE